MKVEQLLQISIQLPIQQIGNSQVFFHLDCTNPEFEINRNRDLLLYHSQTSDFHNKFNNAFKEYSNHPGKFREVFEILINETIKDKYTAIKSAVFPNVNSQIIGQIGGRFLEGGEVDIEQVKIILGRGYTNEIENILNNNLEYHRKQSNKTSTLQDEYQNNENWAVLEKALKASNG